MSGYSVTKVMVRGLHPVRSGIRRNPVLPKIASNGNGYRVGTYRQAYWRQVIPFQSVQDSGLTSSCSHGKFPSPRLSQKA